MTDLIIKLVTDHGLAAALALVAIVLILWHAKWTFLNFRGVNCGMLDQSRSLSRIERDMGRLLERHGLDSIEPPIAPDPTIPAPIVGLPEERPRGFFPRKSTPLPWLVSQTDDKEE